MRSPYSLSRSNLLDDAQVPKSQRKIIKSSQRRIQPSNSLTSSLDDDTSVKDSSKSTSVNVVTPQENLTDDSKSEYEHWRSEDIDANGGCRSSCSAGGETVAAFGDVVSEVFDLINEVAFPEVIDVFTEEKGLSKACPGESYKEDDDSVFNRSKDYDRSKNAKEFLGFIGAVRAPNSKIVMTPIAPSALLTPTGAPLNLPREKGPVIKARRTIEGESPYIEDNIYEGDDDASTVQTRTEKSIGREQRSQTEATDRYSSVHCRDDIEDWSAWEDRNVGKDNGKSDDWSSPDVRKMSEDDYKSYIEDVLYNKEKHKTASVPVTSMQSGLSRSQHMFAYQWKRAKDTYGSVWFSTRATPEKNTAEELDSILPSPVRDGEQPELLTIVESSDEDTREDKCDHMEEDEEHNDEEEKGLERHDQEEDDQERDDDLEAEHDDECDDEGDDEGDHEEAIEELDDDFEVQIEFEEKYEPSHENVPEIFEIDTKEEQEDGTVSSAVSENSLSSYEQRYTDSFVDNSSISTTDDSLLDDSIFDDDESVTNHTGKESLLDESITQHTRSLEMEGSSYEDEYDEDETRRIESLVSTEDEYTESNHKSIAESLLEDSDDDEDYSENNEARATSSSSPIPQASRFCSIYDHLYPSDTLFSFVTQDESVFDFDETSIEQDDDYGPPLSIRTGKSLADEDEKMEVTEIDKEKKDPPGDHYRRDECLEECDPVLEVEEVEHRQQEHNEEMEVDEDLVGSSNKTCDPRDDATETRDSLEEREEDETEAPEDVSRISSTFTSAVYGDSDQISAISNYSNDRSLRRPGSGKDEPVIVFTMQDDKNDGREKDAGTDECSSSGGSGSNGSSTTESTISRKVNGFTDIYSGFTIDRQRMKRRQLSRIKMYNRHKETINKMQKQAE